MHLEQVHRADPLTKSNFNSVLLAWLNTSADARIGPESIHGFTPWLYVSDGSQLFRLNADTKREAVERYLRLVKMHGDNLRWEITTSERGKRTAVMYGPDQRRITPFYLYATGSASATRRSRAAVS